MGEVDRLLIDVDDDGLMRASVWMPPGFPEPVAGVRELVWPLDQPVLDELRWYLEGYLGAPFGVYEDRGSKVEAELAGLGEQVLAGLLGDSGPLREAFLGLRARRDHRLEVVIRSNSPKVLGLPWELLKEPTRPVPLVLDGVSVIRSLPGAGEPFEVAGDRLRVLMVISRPGGGSADVGYQIIARPLLERLSAVRGQVDLVVLRPPTLQAMHDTLAAAHRAGEPFQIVHFDGHGVLYGHDRGMLVFEGPHGGPDRVPAERVAGVLGMFKVPVVVLNACQSGAVGKQLEAAVATRLLAGGAASVVAMAYSVYAVAAAEFMTAFYEELFAGGSVAEAVAQGRARMVRNPGRPSPKGLLELSDWVVPVHYERAPVKFPGLQPTPARSRPSLDQLLDESAGTDPSAPRWGPLEPVGRFVGRDGLFYDLEVALRAGQVVILHGPGGTGKTELAKAFARWWLDTGAVDDPRLVVWHSLTSGLATFGLSGVVNAVGMQVLGTDFAGLDTPTRTAVVQRLLRERRMLLVLDNFESVHSMFDRSGGTPEPSPEERAELAGFLNAVTGGMGGVIVTSRNPEDWLGPQLRRLLVPGLTRGEANEYADELLAPFPAAQIRRKTRDFAHLMAWLGGHPLSMRLVLPHLEAVPPADLLAELSGQGALPEKADGDRGSSLNACVAYSHTHLDDTTAGLLPAVALFQGVVDANVLVLMSDQPGVPDRFAGRVSDLGVMRDVWVMALDRAAAVGLLTPIGGGMYGIHPALPRYLTRWWQTRDGDDYPNTRHATQTALLNAYTGFAEWLSDQINSGDAGLAFTLIELHHRTLTRQLTLALETRNWGLAYTIIEPLTEYWDTQGRNLQARGWVDRALLLLETSAGTPPPLTTPAGELWLFLVGSQADRQSAEGLLDQAEQKSRRLVDNVDTQPRSDTQQRNKVVGYHRLGMIAQQRGELDKAEDLYRRSLTIAEELGDSSGMAAGHHQLGMIAHERGELDQAESSLLRSLTVSATLGDRPGMARTSHELANVSYLRGELDRAEDWCRKSLTIKETLGDRLAIANSYDQLAIIARERGELDRAEDWFRIGLTIHEQLGNRPQMARSCNQLGFLSHLRGELDRAEGWYRKSLTIKEALGDRPGMVLSFGPLGLLAWEREDLGSALEWMVGAVNLFDDFPNSMTAPIAPYFARLTAQLGEPVLERVWSRVTGQPLPEHVRAYVRMQTNEAD